MKSTAVSELKASLSKYLSIIKSGEEVLITEHGKAIARIVPLRRGSKEIPAHLLDLERAGLARIGSGKLPPRFWRWKRPPDPEGLALKALLEERETDR